MTIAGSGFTEIGSAIQGQKLVNPAASTREMWERDAFARLFDSDVSFAGSNPARLETDISPQSPATMPAIGLAETPALGGVVESPAILQIAVAVRGAAAAPGIEEQASMRSGSPIAAALSPPSAHAPMTAPDGDLHLPRQPLSERVQWSRTAWTACLCGDGLHLYLRDGTGKADDRLPELVKRAVRELGLNLSSLKVNGVAVDA